MRLGKIGALAAITSTMLALAAPARADVDTNFANQLHTVGIYGQPDYNAWLAKTTCERLGSGLDTGAEKSARFLTNNLQRGTTTEQTWQFLSAAIDTYCPDKRPILASAARQDR